MCHHNKIHLFERPRRYAAAPTGKDAGATLLGRARFRRRQGRARPSRLSSAGMEVMASPRHANHVWASDITYIPMTSGHLYLVAIIDWASRAVLAWRLSNTMDARFCLDALDEALERHGTPEIFNTDQSVQLEATGIAISMDGRGRFM